MLRMWQAEAARYEQLSLQPLYARPPPVWMHPAFAAEFGDAFIAGTGLEKGTMHVSLEVVVLALQQMCREGGAAAKDTILAHADCAALNATLSALGEGQRLAHKLAHASAHEGQQRMYLSRVRASLAALEPGGLLPIPCSVGGEPVFLLVHRGAGCDDAQRCTLTVVSCDPEGGTLAYHRCSAAPPKIRYETCLELRAVPLARLLDEALWTVIWFAGSAQQDAKLSPAQIFYQLVLSFLAEDSLEQATLKADALRKADCDDALPYRTPRRSRSAHYGVVRHALNYMLFVHGVSHTARRRISLLLRVQMLAMAQHDLGFVRHVSGAERAVLGLACRQLAYKAAKMGRTTSPRDLNNVTPADGTSARAATDSLTVDQLAAIRRAIIALQTQLKAVPGSEPEAIAPPPLILCERSSHLGRPSLTALLGLDDPDATTATLLPPVAHAAGDVAPAVPLDAAFVRGAEVVGLLFSASWCPGCTTATPMLASAYRQLRLRGKALEIVYISLDKEEAAFNTARAKMPWPALPFGGVRAALLAEAFHVQSIPSLVLLRADGSVISTDGIRLMRKHARGTYAPFFF